MINSSSNIYFGSIHNRDTYTLPNGMVKKVPQTSNFFRFESYYNVLESIGKHFKNIPLKEPLNILSIGCGYGEEVYSIAMTMNHYNIPSNITGVDNSQMMLDEIEDGNYRLSDYELKYLKPKNCFLEDKKGPNEFQVAMREIFSNSFELKDKWTNTYTPKEFAFDNCTFLRADARKLLNLYDKTSKDLIMCSYVLDDLKENEQKTLVKNMYEILKPNGILCISPYEVHFYKDLLELQGFKQVSNESFWMFQKPNYDFEIYKY